MAAPITSEVIVEAARRLGEGGYRPTPRQLYYAVCAAVEQPRDTIARELIGLGMILVLVGIITLPVHIFPFFAFFIGTGLALVIVATLNRRRERRRPPSSRPLVISYAAFVGGPLAEATASHGAAIAHLVVVASAPRPARLAASARIVVCDLAESAAMLAANAGSLPDGVVVLEESALGGRARGRRLLCIHDADPRGCELPARLRDAGAAAVRDLGLLPPSADAGLQVIEGAPARLPRDLAGDLTAEQIDWLRSGRRLELATRSPEQAVGLIRAAVSDGPDAG